MAGSEIGKSALLCTPTLHCGVLHLFSSNPGLCQRLTNLFIHFQKQFPETNKQKLKILFLRGAFIQFLQKRRSMEAQNTQTPEEQNALLEKILNRLKLVLNFDETLLVSKRMELKEFLIVCSSNFLFYCYFTLFSIAFFFFFPPSFCSVLFCLVLFYLSILVFCFYFTICMNIYFCHAFVVSSSTLLHAFPSFSSFHAVDFFLSFHPSIYSFLSSFLLPFLLPFPLPPSPACVRCAACAVVPPVGACGCTRPAAPRRPPPRVPQPRGDTRGTRHQHGGTDTRPRGL